MTEPLEIAQYHRKNMHRSLFVSIGKQRKLRKLPVERINSITYDAFDPDNSEAIQSIRVVEKSKPIGMVIARMVKDNEVYKVSVGFSLCHKVDQREFSRYECRKMAFKSLENNPAVYVIRKDDTADQPTMKLFDFENVERIPNSMHNTLETILNRCVAIASKREGLTKSVPTS